MLIKTLMALGIFGVQALEASILIRGLKLPERWVPAVIVAFVIFNLPIPYLLWLQSGARQPPTLIAQWIVRPAFAWQFNWFAFLVFIAPVILLGRVGEWWPGWPILPVLRPAVLSVIGFAAAATVYGLFTSYRAPEVTRLEIELPHLPAQEDGLKLVHFSDPHVAWYTSREEVCRIGEIIAGLSPDLIVITGDMVDHHPDYVYAMADCLDQARPRLGRYAIIGNHDVYTGREPVARRMEERGFRMLRNRWLGLEEAGSSLILAGVDDSGMNWTGPDPSDQKIPQALDGCPGNRPVILLKHRPLTFDVIAGLHVDLVLSGHTHGGQLRLPFGLPGLADFKYRYTSGYYREGKNQIYVTRGTGTVGWPFRLFCPEEITLIILRSPERNAAFLKSAF